MALQGFSVDQLKVNVHSHVSQKQLADLAGNMLRP